MLEHTQFFKTILVDKNIWNGHTELQISIPTFTTSVFGAWQVSF